MGGVGWVVAHVAHFSDSPRGQFPSPFLDLTGTGTWPRSCQFGWDEKKLQLNINVVCCVIKNIVYGCDLESE